MSNPSNSTPCENKQNKNMLNHHQLLNQSERIQLRAMQHQDAEHVYRYRNQAEVSLFQGWTPESPQEVSDYVVQMQSREPAAAGYWYQVILELKDPLKNELAAGVIGDVAFCIEAEHQKQAELGIALDPNFQGQGYAQEAVSALVDFLFTQFNLHRIHVSIDPANSASRKLFERVGFRFEGHLREAVWFKDQWCDDIIMAMLHSEWLNNK